MIVIIDYGLGNLGSVSNAFKKIGIGAKISSNYDDIKKAAGLILPGVGAAGGGMKNLKSKKLDRMIVDEIKTGKPFLGICLGMQLLFEKSEEGNVGCLKILKGNVKKFKKEKKVPQIGWNQVAMQQCNNVSMQQLFKNISDMSYFYFLNSYYCDPEEKNIIAGKTDYGEKFTSVIVKKNIVATQFHPEKSGGMGLLLLKNFTQNLC